MTPDHIMNEIIPKNRRWILTHVPAACRVPARVRPPLYWEALVRAWWATGELGVDS